MEGFENGRLQTAARAVGVMQAAYEAALDYARNRTVFGSSVVDYELTKVKLGRMAVLIQAGRQFAYHVATLMAKGEGAMEASMVKAYVCKAAEWVDPRGDADPRRLSATPRSTPSAASTSTPACCRSSKAPTRRCASR